MQICCKSSSEHRKPRSCDSRPIFTTKRLLPLSCERDAYPSSRHETGIRQRQVPCPIPFTSNYPSVSLWRYRQVPPDCTLRPMRLFGAIMNTLLETAQQNFWLLWCVACTWLVLQALIRLLYLRRKNLLFEMPTPPLAVMFENSSSGRSYKNVLTRFGGANRVLRLAITADRKLYIRPQTFFAVFSYNLDLFHIIDLKQASITKIYSSFRGQAYHVSGPCELTGSVSFESIPTNREEFERHLLCNT